MITVKIMDQPTQVEMQVVQSKDQIVILAIDWIQKYKAVIDMNQKCITFWIDRRKFTTKLVSDIKSQNKVHYYTMGESEENIIDLILIEDDIMEAMKGNDKDNLIIIDFGDSGISSESKTEQIPDNIKGR